MTLYPFSERVKSAAGQMKDGNFGLWYNKFVPLSDNLKASDNNGDDTRAVEYYRDIYNNMKRSPIDFLRKKHQDQESFCASFPQHDYEVITIKATLTSPLITGIGESHPHEVSMVFDHNLGIPYIPATGVKGIVRFAHTLSIIGAAVAKDPEIEKTGKFDDEEEWTLIPLMFGNQKNRGKVVFLDSYPEKVPNLRIDIMNPHYGEYYTDPEKKKPPADYLKPNPIKFLTVAQGTVFIFRAIARKENDIPQKVREAIARALTKEGVGAKTAVGYGRFKIEQVSTNADSVNIQDTVKPIASSGTQTAPTVEIWDGANVSYNAGGGGKIQAQIQGKPMAFLEGRGNINNLKNAVSEELHGKLFKDKKLVNVRVAVRKVGNAWQIVKVESKS